MAFSSAELANIANAALDYYIDKGSVYSQSLQDKPLLKAMDSGSYPAWLVNETITRESVAEAIDQAFAIDNRDEALAFIDHNTKLWMRVPGTRGAIGKKTVNAQTYFNSLFDTDDDVEEQEEQELNEEKLEVLEDEQLHSEA